MMPGTQFSCKRLVSNLETDKTQGTKIQLEKSDKFEEKDELENNNMFDAMGNNNSATKNKNENNNI